MPDTTEAPSSKQTQADNANKQQVLHASTAAYWAYLWLRHRFSGTEISGGAFIVIMMISKANSQQHGSPHTAADSKQGQKSPAASNRRFTPEQQKVAAALMMVLMKAQKNESLDCNSLQSNGCGIIIAA